MESILKEAIKPVVQWLVELGLIGVITILTFVILISLIKSTWFTDLVKYLFSSGAREIDRLNKSIELLSDDDDLQELLKKKRRSLIFQREYGVNLTDNKMNIVKSIKSRVGDEFTLYKIVKAVNYYAGTNNGGGLLRNFSVWDKTGYILQSAFGVVAIIISSILLLTVYFSLVFPEWQLLSLGERKNAIIIRLGLIFSSFLMIFGGMLVASMGWPYRYASDIKKLIVELDLSEKINELPQTKGD